MDATLPTPRSDSTEPGPAGEAIESPVTTRERARAAIRPCAWICWGCVLMVVDFTISQRWGRAEGFQVDLISDTVGAMILSVSLFWLSAAELHRSATAILTALFWGSLLLVAETLREHLILRFPLWIRTIGALIDLGVPIGAALLALSLEWICAAAGLDRSARRWCVARWLVLLLWLLPSIIGGGLALVVEGPRRIDLGVLQIPLMILAFLVSLLPILQCFRSVSSMRREISEPPRDAAVPTA